MATKFLRVGYQQLNSNSATPIKGTSESAASDIINPKRFLVKPGRNIVPTGFRIAFPDGYEAEIMSRSGMSAKGMLGYSANYTEISCAAVDKYPIVKRDIIHRFVDWIVGRNEEKIIHSLRYRYKKSLLSDERYVDWDSSKRFNADVITGKIDPDYRGEVGVIINSNEHDPFWIEAGERIAQITFIRVEKPVWCKMKELPASERDSGGFGSTGTKTIGSINDFKK